MGMYEIKMAAWKRRVFGIVVWLELLYEMPRENLIRMVTIRDVKK